MSDDVQGEICYSQPPKPLPLTPVQTPTRLLPNSNICTVYISYLPDFFTINDVSSLCRHHQLRLIPRCPIIVLPEPNRRYQSAYIFLRTTHDAIKAIGMLNGSVLLAPAPADAPFYPELIPTPEDLEQLPIFVPGAPAAPLTDPADLNLVRYEIAAVLARKLSTVDSATN